MQVFQDAYKDGTEAQARLTGLLGKKYVDAWEATAGTNFDPQAPGLVSHFHSECTVPVAPQQPQR